MSDSITRPRISLAISNLATDEELAFARQLGVDCVYSWVNEKQMDLTYLQDLRRRVDEAGLCLYNVGNFGVGKSDKIHLNLPGRDEVIERFQSFVRDLGRAGIGVTTFTWEPDAVWSSPHTASRGARARHVDLAEMAQRPLTHDRIYTEEEMWDNMA